MDNKDGLAIQLERMLQSGKEIYQLNHSRTNRSRCPMALGLQVRISAADSNIAQATSKLNAANNAYLSAVSHLNQAYLQNPEDPSTMMETSNSISDAQNEVEMALAARNDAENNLQNAVSAQADANNDFIAHIQSCPQCHS